MGNHVEKILQQSLAKVSNKELKKTNPRKPVVKKVPTPKPRIDGPVFSQSPIPMKRVKLGGRQKKTTFHFPLSLSTNIQAFNSNTFLT